jgi:hypothetical protein
MKDEAPVQEFSYKGPEELWLQLHGDCSDDELTDPVDYTDDSVTWCWHQIHNSDVRYVRADIATPPAARRQWIGLTDEEMYLNCPNWLSHEQCKTWVQQIEAKLKEKNTAAQPAVPDAIHHTDLSEHPQYIQGWNDCRAEMLKGMKP